MGNIKVIKNSELFADVEEVVNGGGSVRLRVKGYSMRPFLRDGRDVVELAPTDGIPLKAGMVVLFRHNGKHILHRIRHIGNDRLTIKGDGNYRITEYAVPSDVAAYVRSAERGGRSVSYGTSGWRWLSLRSLALKLLRTGYIDLKKAVKKIIGRK